MFNCYLAFIPVWKYFLINVTVVTGSGQVLGEIYLWSVRVSVKFFYQVHAAFGVDGPVDNSVTQAHPLQMNCYDFEHAGPLGHDHAKNDQKGETVRITHTVWLWQLMVLRGHVNRC